MKTLTFYMYATAGPYTTRRTIKKYEDDGWAVRTLCVQGGGLWIVLEKEEEE